jgi:hypothetical protein
MPTKTKTKQAKRILEVKAIRSVDESPDTSYLGEYSNRATSEFSIDRAHSEDCESLTPEFKAEGEWSHWNGTASEILFSVRVYLEENRTICDEHIEVSDENCEDCQTEYAEQSALDTVWELEKHAGKCDCGGHNVSSRELPYFNPSFNYVTKQDKPADGLTPDDVRKYVRQDYERMESLNAGNWCYIGISAQAEFSTGSVIQTIHSGGLWGIESDSDRPYLESVEKEELDSLKTELSAIGFSSRAISKAFKSIEEVNA